MGMIFNSPNTLNILELLQNRYNENGFQGNKHHDLTVLQDPTKPHLHDKATGCSINLPPGQDTPWETWCNNMDNANQSQYIVDAMIMYLKDPNCLAIEFYAIQSNTVTVTPIPPNQQATQYFGVILIETPTYDSAVHWERRRRGGPSNGRGSRK